MSQRPVPSDERVFFGCSDGHQAIWWKSRGAGNAKIGTDRPQTSCPLCAQRRLTRKLEAVRRHAEYLRGKLNEWERRAGKPLTRGMNEPARGYFDDE